MSTDVAGATFMAAATSAPELFVNIIGTFITEGDLGIGTIVGSAVFNTLGVAAVCGVVSGVTIKLDWWPLTRDTFIYGLTVSSLIVILYDGTVQWYEALGLVCFYFVYLLIMYNDKNLQKRAKESPTCHKFPCFDMTLDDNINRDSVTSKAGEDDRSSHNMCKLPTGKGCFHAVCWVLQYPIYLMFYVTIPDCRMEKLRKLYPLTFLMCCFWISVLSYLVAWMITAVGDTFNIPDSVMGITFLAIGTSIPEAVSSVIVARRGYGSMAICNSIGSNTFDVLVCLGFPWLIKTIFFPSTPGNHSLDINSSGLIYSTVTLLSAVFMLFTSFVCTKFTLGKTVGYACLFLYISFVIFAILMEMNVFFVVNLPMCTVN
ncbi:sodium/potassium/calcium exchanger 3-like isoform X2 [Eupeodes corollae]|nr:sodium/potassium/calcium exchanger 3-like isoform X2 [Eupeodes corollae]